ncbi:heavy metal-binding domain-containing protein [Tepidibacter aestuarii]|uniref:heavy metal-binding domain-containing protein n=1 Tax=Tepidibacter aestuarii TaxID=2925782 RepID=UPI0020BFA998|nr:heavy metal-binding domain-containing protein [Tepidibacter aestuarii]CAH2212062.1 putative heavy metal binding protein YbjQ [Tepidibacter aestuarii]
MIITTTNTIQGKNIKEYKGIVFGEVIVGVNIIKDFMAGVRDIVGGRSKAYENTLGKSREEAIEELKRKATALGSNAVVGLKVDYETLGQNGGMIMVTVSGTAVVFE